MNTNEKQMNGNVVAVLDDKLVYGVLRKHHASLVLKNGKMRQSYYSFLCDEITKRVEGFILDCYYKAENDIGITERNIKAHLANHRYELCWKNDENGTKQFEVVNILTNIEDAKAIINARKMGKSEIYKIVEIKDGVAISVDYSTQNYSSTGVGEEF
jgi:hypothetical protein